MTTLSSILSDMAVAKSGFADMTSGIFVFVPVVEALTE